MVDLRWMKELVTDVPQNKRLYKISCRLLFKKYMTYNELYMFIFGLNRKKLGEKDAKTYSFARIIEIYKYNNNGQIPNLNDVK